MGAWLARDVHIHYGMNSVKFLGTTDEVDTCDCCGKKNLKSTVALSIDEGDAVYFGVTCAARALKMAAKDVRANARKADDEKARAAREAAEAIRRAEDARWGAWLTAHSTETDRFLQIQSLGGFKAARAAYEAA